MERSAAPNAKGLLTQCGAPFPASVLLPLAPASLGAPGNFCFLRIPGCDLIIAVLVTYYYLHNMVWMKYKIFGLN